MKPNKTVSTNTNAHRKKIVLILDIDEPHPTYGLTGNPKSLEVLDKEMFQAKVTSLMREEYVQLTDDQLKYVQQSLNYKPKLLGQRIAMKAVGHRYIYDESVVLWIKGLIDLFR